MPTLFLSGSAAATGIATINSIGNLGGFVGPLWIGWIKDQTGSFEWRPLLRRRPAGPLRGPHHRWCRRTSARKSAAAIQAAEAKVSHS